VHRAQLEFVGSLQRIEFQPGEQASLVRVGEDLLVTLAAEVLEAVPELRVSATHIDSLKNLVQSVLLDPQVVNDHLQHLKEGLLVLEGNVA